MRVLSIPFERVEPSQKTVVGIGVFDGFHLGHQMLIREVLSLAARYRCQSAALTFSPHPRHLFTKQEPFPLLEALSQRLTLFSKIGLDVAAVANFTLPFSRMTPAQFAEDILRARLRALHVVVGKNFRFGAKQEGGVASLTREGKRLGFEVCAVDATTHGGSSVSSTQIRRLLEAGEALEAGALLGRPYQVQAKVISRPKSTRNLMGFALAQLGEIQAKLLPYGVYAASIEIGTLGRFNGIFAICPEDQQEVFGAPALIHLYGYHGPKFRTARVRVDVVGKLHDWPAISDPMMWRTLVSADQSRTLALNQRIAAFRSNLF